MPLAFYLDFATKQEGLRRFIDSKGLLTPRIGSLSCRPLPPSDNKGRDLAVIKQILHGYILSERKIRDPMIIEDVTNPMLNSINEKCARIRAAFVGQFDDYMAKSYYIDGLRGEVKKIALPRNLVTWE